jgi:hypothetical protein
MAECKRFDLMTNAELLRFNVLQPHSAPSAQAVPRLFNATQETRIMFETDGTQTSRLPTRTQSTHQPVCHAV